MLGHALTEAQSVRTTGGVVLQSKHGKFIPLVFVKKQKGKGNKGESHTHSTLIRGGLPLPERLTVRTRFQTSFSMNNAGVNYANRRYSPVFCYDVDPTLGSTSMPFFTEIMTLYRYYRTMNSKIRVQFINLEAAAIHTAYICPVNFDPTANTSSYQSYLSNPNSRSVILGNATGESRGTLTHSASTNMFAGSRFTGTEDAYSGNATGTAPINQWYWIVGSYCPQGFTAGVAVDITIDITFVAYEEGTPST